MNEGLDRMVREIFANITKKHSRVCIDDGVTKSVHVVGPQGLPPLGGAIEAVRVLEEDLNLGVSDQADYTKVSCDPDGACNREWVVKWLNLVPINSFHRYDA